MLSIALNPYLDEILRQHVLAAARRLGIALDELERLLQSEADAVEFLKECGAGVYEDYLEDWSERIDHVGWVVVPTRKSSAEA